MIFNVTGGGGGTGCTLTITAPLGATVTVSKDNKAKPSKVATTGTVVFKGLETGTWTITITNGSDTATKTVEIKADYSAEITFFSAIINITYPAGLTCTATDGVTTLTAPDTSGAWACVVPNKGKWTITAGEWSAEAAMTTSGQTATVRVAKWIVKDGANTAIGLTKQLITAQLATLTQETGYVHIVTPKACGMLSDAAIDMTGVKTIIADIDAVKVGTNTSSPKFNGNALALTKGAAYSIFNDAKNGIGQEHISTETGRQTLRIDAESITDPWYVGFVMASTGDIKVYSLRAEV